ncbi:MAG TPA: hypothetical protein VE954_14475, partial [Oligoflexus sp.]|uniref:hypothetical protein n=1 Tax=Oligoflexus sp. TaxID=1971216 RepID=UPI002D752B46
MRCLTLSLVALLAFSCKSSARKHAEAPRAEVETLAPDPQQKQNEPATEAVEKPVEEPAKKEAMETPKDQAMQSGPTAAFPFTIEMPKSRIPNPASSDDQDNSCPSFT